MRFSTATIALAASTVVSAAPAKHNGSKGHQQVKVLNDGFPNSSPEQILKIQKEAFGTLSNANPPPAPFKEDTFTSIRLVAFNEIFEAFYFDSFLKNMSDPHFLRTFPKDLDKGFVIETLKSIRAVEEIHAQGANNALVKVGKKDPIKACEYKFPVDDFASALSLAGRFTDVVMGTLQDVIFDAATAGDAGFTPGVAASLGDEGEQTGFFRSALGLRPQSQPFLTRSIRDYAFSLLQDFVVPGSCPNEQEIDLTIFQPLTAADPPAHNADIEFTFSLKPQRFVPKGSKTVTINDFKRKYGGSNWKKLTISYLNGQNKPVSVPLKHFSIDGEKVTVKAFFPQEDNTFFGLVLAALTVGDGFQTAQDMVDGTLFGPTPLEVQERKVKAY